MVDISHYATEQDVYNECGIAKEVVMRVTGLNDNEVTILLNSFLKTAEAKIKNLLQLPHVVPRELHLGTGEDMEFDLGPEDEEIYFDFDPADCVEMAKACFFVRRRKKLPYPKDCDGHTDDASQYGGTATVSNDASHVQAGDYAMKIVFASGVQNAYYPTTQDLNKPIDKFDFASFRAETNTADVTFEVRLYDRDGNYDHAYFILPKTNKSFIIHLDLESDFTHAVGSIDWDLVNLYYWEIRANKACTLYLDNFNFNDEWFFTAPSGKLVIARKMVDPSSYVINYSLDCPPEDGYPLYVTYTYDPFRIEVPENIRSATAQFAGVKLIDHLLGVRESSTAFEFESESLELLGDKETMYHTRGTLLARAKQNLNAYGYGFAGGVAR